jgi:hypothetical protein
MARKSKKSPATEAENSLKKAVPCVSGPSVQEQGRSYARLLTSPDFAAYRIIGMMQPKNLVEGIDAPTMVVELTEQAKAVQRGDLRQAEAMLINQASALQALFVRLSEKAMEQTHMPNLEGFMRLALRAQSQCRASLEALAAIKNPPIVYARQANVTTGPQQVNNGVPVSVRAREIETEQTQLSVGTDELPPNARTSGHAGGDDSTLEAMGKIDWTELPGG